MKPLVIYHDNCADGFGAAFAAWLKFGDEAEYRACQYGRDDFEEGETVQGREVYILDFSFPRDMMEWLFAGAKKVVWLDHHKTAFEMWCGGIPDVGIWREDSWHDGATPRSHYILLDNNKSGAMIAWEYFHPEKEVPMLIKHIDDYDRWQFKLENTKPFIKALWSYAPWSFEQWRTEFAEGYYGFIKEGAAILRAHEQNVDAIIEGAVRYCKLTGPIPLSCADLDDESKKGLAANCPPHLASDVGHELANRSGTYGLLWHINTEGKCLCSLRSNGSYDVSDIAKAFGGGGHKNAAGFQVDIQTLLSWIGVNK